MKVAVILPAAGLGTRMGKGSAEKTGTSRKQFMLLEGSPILMHTVRKFLACGRATDIVVAVRAEDLEWVGGMLSRAFPDSCVRAVEGGNTRQHQRRGRFNLPAVATQLDRATQVVKGVADAFYIPNVIIYHNKHTLNQTPALIEL